MEQLRLGLLAGWWNVDTQYQKNHMGAGKAPIWRLHEYNKNVTKLQAREDRLADALPGLRYGTVRKAEPFGEAHVGCIEVADNHNFFLSDRNFGVKLRPPRGHAPRRTLACRHPRESLPRSFSNASGGITYHAIIKHMDGSSEDPSAILGMPVKPGVREEEIRKNQERYDNLIKDAAEVMVMSDGEASPKRSA